jgi:hypothetical protein
MPENNDSSHDFSVLLRALSQLQDAAAPPHLAAGGGTTTNGLLPTTLPTIVAIGNQSDGKSSTIGTGLADFSQQKLLENFLFSIKKNLFFYKQSLL